VQLVGAPESLLRLHELGLSSLHVRGLLERRKMLRIGGAELRQRARERGALLLDGVLKLLAIELEKRLTRVDAVAEVRAQLADASFGLRRDRHFIDCREGADDVNRPMERLFAHALDLHRLGGIVAAARLGGLGFRARGGARRRESH